MAQVPSLGLSELCTHTKASAADGATGGRTLQAALSHPHGSKNQVHNNHSRLEFQ